MTFVVSLSILLIAGLIWIGIIALLRSKKQASIPYLIFSTIFYIYIVKVLDYTFFQFQVLLLLKYFMPNLMLNGQAAGNSVNFIPLIALTSQDLNTSLLNILLFVPFGFGLPFISNFRAAKIIVIAAVASIVIELLQLVTGLLAGTTFRIADINDVIFNTLGAAIGYVIYVGFVNLVRSIWKTPTNPIVRHIVLR